MAGVTYKAVMYGVVYAKPSNQTRKSLVLFDHEPLPAGKGVNEQGKKSAKKATAKPATRFFFGSWVAW
eukprot:6057039-Pleurochrysis_carterae.AAC.1